MILAGFVPPPSPEGGSALVPMLVLGLAGLVTGMIIRYFRGDWEARWAARLQAPFARKVRGDFYVMARYFRHRVTQRRFRKELDGF